MSKKILITAVNLQAAIEQYLPLFREHGLEVILPTVHGQLEEEELLDWVREVEGIIAGDDPFTGRVLRNAQHLRVISRWGTGLDNIDLAACEELGITVTNIPVAFTVPVADLVMGFILAFARQIPWADHLVRSGEWATIPARTLQECTLGIIGLGNIGKAVARRAAGFGMGLLGHDLKPVAREFLREIGLELVSLEALLHRADFISLNCNLNSANYHLIGNAQFEMMKPEAVLINTSRGGLVDEQALIRALRDGRIAGACLDVFETEPLPADSPLRGMRNVLLSPHNGHSSPQAHENAHRQAIDNLLAILEAS